MTSGRGRTLPTPSPEQAAFLSTPSVGEREMLEQKVKDQVCVARGREGWGQCTPLLTSVQPYTSKTVPRHLRKMGQAAAAGAAVGMSCHEEPATLEHLASFL